MMSEEGHKIYHTRGPNACHKVACITHRAPHSGDVAKISDFIEAIPIDGGVLRCLSCDALLYPGIVELNDDREIVGIGDDGIY